MKHGRFISLLVLASAIAILLFTVPTWAQNTLFVPSQYPTIQEAIDAASYGDTVQVAAGTYYENVWMKDGVSLIGAGAEVTIIDGQGWTAVDCDDGKLSVGTKLSGFTITNSGGEAILAYDSLLIENCIISNNPGTGIVAYGSNVITNCTFIENWSGGDGGAISISGAATTTIRNCTFLRNLSVWGNGGAINGNAIITNSTFSENRAGDDGGAISSWSSSAIITNCTFWGNSTSGYGGGIWSYVPNIITNSILWGNYPEDLSDYGSPFPSGGATYSVVGTGVTYGEGNISADPKFIDPAAGNFRLHPTSPCIDAGSNSAPGIPETDFEGKPRIVDGDEDGIAIADIGAYEYSPNSPSGMNVTVSFDIGVSVTFASVSVKGETVVTTSSSGPSLPAEFILGNPPTYYEISTTAVYTPPVTVCISYNPMQYGDNLTCVCYIMRATPG